MTQARNMGTQEKMQWIFNKASCVNFVVYARVQGEISEHGLRNALGQLRRRHPALNASIAPRGWWGARLELGACAEIDLRLVAPADGNDLAAVLEAECTQRFSATGPLTRCVLVRHSTTQSSLLLTMDHAIADAMSGVFALQSVLSQLGSGDAAGPVHAPLSLASPIEAHFPKHMVGIRGWMKHVAFVARTLERDFRAKPAAPYPPEKTARYEDCRTLVVPRELAPHQLEQLQRCARSHGVTLNSLLLAAKIIATAMQRDITEPSTFTTAYSINLRKLVTPAIGDDVGVFLSGITTTHEAHRGSDLIALAKDVQRAKEATLRNDEHFIGYPKFIQCLNALLAIFGTGRIGVKVYTDLFKSFPLHAAMSNLGNLDLPTQYGELTLERVGFALSPPVWGLIDLFASSLNGHLSLNFTALAPLVSRASLCDFADRMLALLEDNSRAFAPVSASAPLPRAS